MYKIIIGIIKISPIRSNLYSPNRSPSVPMAMPNNAPIKKKSEATKPAIVRVSSKSLDIVDKVGGTFPTCIAAITPLATASKISPHFDWETGVESGSEYLVFMILKIKLVMIKLGFHIF